MASGVHVAVSTREKLERARSAASGLAQLSTEEKNAFLGAIADALEAELRRAMSG